MKTALPSNTRQSLAHSARAVRSMRAVPAVIVQSGDVAEIARLRAELDQARAERDAALHAAAARAQREDRVRAITLRVVDRRADWAAKQGLKARPLVALTSQRIITADVWEQPAAED
jgi:hypothetical protein